MPTKILLFDLDGVLLQPGGYRAAVKETMEYFLRQMGMASANLVEEDIALFESMGITSEWDIVPISLALVFEEIIRPMTNPPQLTHLGEAVQWAGEHSAGNRHPPYPQRLQMLADLLQNGQAPSQALLTAVRENRSNDLLTCLAGMPFLDDLLANTRSVEHSLVTRVFQNLVLGSADFQKTYDRLPLIECRSALKLHDRPLIHSANLDIIRDLHEKQKISAAVLTARPSLPPPGIPPQPGYSPEAEQALELLGLANLPLIGYGRLAYVAGLHGADPESYLKPSPVQALAAIAGAWTRTEVASLNWAVSISHNKSQNSYRLHPDLPDQLEIHIFEDTPIGIQSVRQAVAILNQIGKQAALFAWGIAVDPNKTAALVSNNAAVHSNINLALNQVFNMS